LFAEQRTFLNESDEFFIKTNFDYTLEVINKFKDISNKVIIYSTSELWNKYDGCVSLNDQYNYNYSPYIKSKEILCNYINNNRDVYPNVIIIYPFNFNSVHRKEGFLFGKIFDSIINKKVIEIGDTYFYRDIIHPKFVVNESINASSHKIVGSGRLVYVNDFIRDLYKHFDMNYNDYVIENIDKFNEYDKRKEYYIKSSNCLYDYKQLMIDTIKDINNKIL
jgi:nucleoside-diphosphate-sugar epimerase